MVGAVWCAASNLVMRTFKDASSSLNASICANLATKAWTRSSKVWVEGNMAWWKGHTTKLVPRRPLQNLRMQQRIGGWSNWLSRTANYSDCEIWCSNTLTLRIHWCWMSVFAMNLLSTKSVGQCYLVSGVHHLNVKLKCSITVSAHDMLNMVWTEQLAWSCIPWKVPVLRWPCCI
jgi:hypothetical protein